MTVQIAKKLSMLERSATDEIDNIVRQMAMTGINDIISFGGGEPCFDTPANIQEAAVEALHNGKTKYEPTCGDYQLREEICKKLQRKNGINTTPENIVVTPGGKFAAYLTFQTLLNPGDKVMLLEPAWVSYEAMARLAGAEAVHIPSYEENGFLPDLDEISRSFEPSVRLVVINSPCNPTGAVYPPELIKAIAQIADRHGAMVVSDEIYEDILYKGVHYSAGADFENVITLNGFSKSFAMTGWRLGYLNAPLEVVEGMIKIYQHSATCVNSFAQGGAIEALRSEESAQATRRMAEGYRERCDLITDLMQETGFFKGFAPQGAFYAFPSYTMKKSSLEVATLLLEQAHVATVPGSAFGACGEGHLRFAYSTSKENIVEAFRRISDLFTKLAGKRN